MRFSLRHKIAIGLGGILLLTLGLGAYAVVQVTAVERAIDTMLRANYRTVIACQDMKEALERIDSGTLFILSGSPDEGRTLITANLARFDTAYGVEEANITEPGEAGLVADLTRQWASYRDVLPSLLDPTQSLGERKQRYFVEILPLFQSLKLTENRILDLNQKAILASRDRAAHRAAQTRQHLYLLLIVAAACTVGFVIYLGRSVLMPLREIIDSTREIARGNLDLVVKVSSRDEIGTLAESFNAMTERLREFRRTDRERLLLVESTTQLAIDSLPDGIIVLSTDGAVELANRAARNLFGFRPGMRAGEMGAPWMPALLDECRRQYVVHPKTYEWAIQVFYEGEEHFYLPKAVAILDEATKMKVAGFTVVLSDITALRKVDEMKSGLVSTVAHELETPLTSIRMALHILSEERVGELAPKQAELATVARDEADRLHQIITDLLDLSRLKAGEAHLGFVAVRPGDTVEHAVEAVRASYEEKGIALSVEITPDLPEISADPVRLVVALGNLLSNALKYTDRGGSVRLAVEPDDERHGVRFIVSDTGRGIEQEHLSAIFDPFFRASAGSSPGGAGLGLAIVREIAKAHGGTVECRSVVNEGSTFTLFIPREQPSS